MGKYFWSPLCLVNISQGFFANPLGASIGVSFLERYFQVLGCVCVFGGLTVQFKLFFQKNNKMPSLVWICVLGVSIFLILTDQKYICIWVQTLLKSHPVIHPLLQYPLGPISILFASGVLVQLDRFPFPLLVHLVYGVYYIAQGCMLKLLLPIYLCYQNNLLLKL